MRVKLEQDGNPVLHSENEAEGNEKYDNYSTECIIKSLCSGFPYLIFAES
jgi:hypothetical protein